MVEIILRINTLRGLGISTLANYHISKLTIYVEEKDCLVSTDRSGDLY
jgi:hypothetical protein